MVAYSAIGCRKSLAIWTSKQRNSLNVSYTPSDRSLEVDS